MNINVELKTKENYRLKMRFRTKDYRKCKIKKSSRKDFVRLFFIFAWCNWKNCAITEDIYSYT